MVNIDGVPEDKRDTNTFGSKIMADDYVRFEATKPDSISVIEGSYFF